ncbi:MAG: CBO0543 family protein [Bacillus sp. (in: firmicutes)]
MYSQLEKAFNKYLTEETQIWLHHDLWSAHWWSILIINALFFVLLLVLIDRYRILLISLAFVISFIIVGLVDELGTYFDYWEYPHQFLVFTHRFNAVDFAVIPVIMTLCYQYFRRWKAYLVAEVILSAVISFIGIPLCVYFNLYTFEDWNYFYSLIVSIILFIALKIIVDFIEKKAKKCG